MIYERFSPGVSDYAEIVEDEGDYSMPGSKYSLMQLSGNDPSFFMFSCEVLLTFVFTWIYPMLIYLSRRVGGGCRWGWDGVGPMLPDVM